MLNPIYTPKNTRAVHLLHYDWTGWLKDQAAFPATLSDAIKNCRDLWASDGMKLEKRESRLGQLQLMFNVIPQLSPSLFVQRVKGRLSHALRKAGTPVQFRVKKGFRSLGKNTREIVQAYIAKQSRKSDYVDPRFRKRLEQFHVDNRAVALKEASATGHGRYWYNLHLVLVVQDRRFPMERNDTFLKARNTILAIAKKKGYAIAELFVMPDHIHVALRGNIEHSPQDIALAFLNNLSYVFGYNRVWNEEYYVGTFGEYRLDQV